MSANKPIVIKLLCPSMSKLVELLVSWDEEKIDLGYIATVFGLQPWTVKFNGYFISRGLDLVASSVTWKSLLSFFSSKGLPTGQKDSFALHVTGKLCKSDNKRKDDLQDAVNMVCKVMEGGNSGSIREMQLETIDFPKNKKLRESNLVDINLGVKRKQSFEDFNLFKKLRTNDDRTDNQDEASVLSSDISGNWFTCRSASKNLKRIREEAIAAAPCKRIR